MTRLRAAKIGARFEMRSVSVAAAAAAGVLALAGCGPSGGGNTGASPSAGPPPAAAPPATLTDAQRKTLLAQLPAAYQGADLANGEAKFAVCRSCHTTAQGGEDMTGPNLWAIFGRRAGGREGFNYSDDLKHAGWSWDATRIDAWIANPRALLANTKMTFAGLTDPTDRRDLIAFLKVQTSPAP
jgi:cytochrome c